MLKVQSHCVARGVSDRQINNVLINRQKRVNIAFHPLTLEAVVGVDVAQRAVVADAAVTHEAASRVLAVSAILAR